MSSADNHCKQFGPRSGPTDLNPKLFDTLMVFLKDFFEEVSFENEVRKKISCQEKFLLMLQF